MSPARKYQKPYVLIALGVLLIALSSLFMLLGGNCRHCVLCGLEVS